MKLTYCTIMCNYMQSVCMKQVQQHRSLTNPSWVSTQLRNTKLVSAMYLSMNNERVVIPLMAECWANAFKYLALCVSRTHQYTNPSITIILAYINFNRISILWTLTQGKISSFQWKWWVVVCIPVELHTEPPVYGRYTVVLVHWTPAGSPTHQTTVICDSAWIYNYTLNYDSASQSYNV